MKNIVFGVLAFVLIISYSDATAQCDPEPHTSACIPKLSSGFNFLKSYKVDGQMGGKERVEYSYVFTTGTQYMINVCAGNGGNDGIVVSLYDSKRNLVATSVHDGQQLSAFIYPCTTTGIYYITYTFDGSSTFCGGSAMGFKR
ncbi:MAG: hypothetical protein OEY51_01855 [Cyclobacteriaceae bacterium]|nr:hypothetical protein [Cyclobacteriaceae bacterium]